MLEEEQLNGSSPQSSTSERVLHDTTSNGTEHPKAEDKSPTYFIAKVRHSLKSWHIYFYRILLCPLKISIFFDLLDSLAVGYTLF